MSGQLSVYRDREIWRWRYTEPRSGGAPFVLDAAPAHPDPDAAADAARTAYPGVPLRIEQRPHRSRRWRQLLLHGLGRSLILLMVTLAVLARMARRN